VLRGFLFSIRSLLAELRNENKKDQLRDSGEGF
jgi:hypothetical protein